MPLIKFNVRNQNLRQYNSVVVAANSHNYLKLQFNFLTEDWASVGTKTVWLVGYGRIYPVILDENNQCYVKDTVIVPPGFAVTVSGGGITTNSVEIPVVSNGCDQGCASTFDVDLYNQLIDKINNVEKSKADNIVRDEDGSIQLSSNGTPIGDKIDAPDCGIKNFEVDANDNITVTLIDGRVIELGQITGASGATFTPHISEDLILSWTNDKNLPNPAPVDISPFNDWVDDDDQATSDYIWVDE